MARPERLGQVAEEHFQAGKLRALVRLQGNVRQQPDDTALRATDCSGDTAAELAGGRRRIVQILGS